MPPLVIDLGTLTAPGGFVIQGDAANDSAGHSVAVAGDVNGDGIDDLIVGAYRGDDGGTNAGEAYVVYGQIGTTRGRLDLTDLAATQGFVIQGDALGDRAGSTVAGVGDVNSDGLSDLIVGATFVDNGGTDAGVAYVIYGQRGNRGRLDLTTLTAADGFVIQGDAAGDLAGSSVAGAGDVNGDGIADLIVGARLGDDGGYAAGEAYVIYGQSGSTRVGLDLTTLAAADGFVIQGVDLGDEAGSSVAGAGDVNGDGLADLIVGAPRSDDGGNRAGEAYVIYGQTGIMRGRLDLTGLAAADGFVIQGDAAGDLAGSSVAGAGDVNGDGLDDLIVGARYGDDGGDFAGEAYVIYGRTGSTRARLDLTNLATVDGFVIQGDTAADSAGYSVASAGDVNGDGLDDLVVGALSGDDGGYAAGEAYVIFGQPGAARGRLDLTNLNSDHGFVIQGDAAEDFAGISVAGAGDVNGDGLADLIVGADFGDDGGNNAGEANVIYGFAAPRTLDGTAAAETLSAAGGNDRLTGGGGDDLLLGRVGRDTLLGGLGNDTLDGGSGGDRINGGAGLDLLSYSSAKAGVTADFARGLFREDGQDRDSVIGVEGVIGSDLADRLTGGTSAVTLLGGDGDDRIIGGEGADSLNGGAGDDVILDRLGAAQIGGGTGDDQITGSSSADRLGGDAGNDRVTGGSGDDTLSGGLDNDSLSGGLGNDTLIGGTGNDTLTGDGGRDVFVFAAGFGQDRITDFADGLDRLDFSAHTGVADFGDLTLTALGADVEIRDGAGGVLLLANTALGAIGTEDFLF